MQEQIKRAKKRKKEQYYCNINAKIITLIQENFLKNFLLLSFYMTEPKYFALVTLELRALDKQNYAKCGFF